MQNGQDDGGAMAEEEEEDIETYEAQLSVLRKKSPKYFAFYYSSAGSGRWTDRQARDVEKALMRNKTVDHLSLDLGVCPFSSIHLFKKFIKSSQTLENVSIYYNAQDDNAGIDDSLAIQQQYHKQIDNIFHSISRNPSIGHLDTNHLGQNPSAIYSLFSTNKTLTSFRYELGKDDPITDEMAFAVAGGLARNPSIESVRLGTHYSPMLIIMSGIGGVASSIRSLSVEFESGERPPPSEEISFAVSRVLYATPSLKSLKIATQDEPHDAWINPVFHDLRQPACAGLVELKLSSVALDIDRSTSDILDAVSTKNQNHTLRILRLYDICFANRTSVCLLWHFVGLKELEVCYPAFQDDLEENTDDDPDCWAEFVRRNKKIQKVMVRDKTWKRCGMGIVDGACGLKSLQTLEFLDPLGSRRVHVDEVVGAQLYRLLDEVEALQTLTLSTFKVDRKGGKLLAAGIGNSKSLKRITLHRCRFHIDSMKITLQGLQVNRKLKTFNVERSTIQGDDRETSFCQALSQVFRENDSLKVCGVPQIAINAESMAILVGGLQRNKTMESMDFSECTLDQGALFCLYQALLPESPTKLSLSTIQLPAMSDGERMKPFLRHLPRMRRVQKVVIHGSLEAKEENLLLQAIKVSKTLHFFERERVLSGTRVDNEIDFYLKLNRFGRQDAESPNRLPRHLWPLVLSPMANDPENVGALFYFAREYFSNHHEPKSLQEQQQRKQPTRAFSVKHDSFIVGARSCLFDLARLLAMVTSLLISGLVRLLGMASSALRPSQPLPSGTS